MRKFGLIGYPLAQSFSNKFFTQKFAAENLYDCVHEVYPIKTIDELTPLIKDPELIGLNVTIPYKKAVIPFLDEVDEVVQKIQACNCIKIIKGKLKGYNTDVIGFERSLVPHLKRHHKKALILGTGGSSVAVEFVLQKLGIEYLFVSRSESSMSNTITYENIDSSLMHSYHLIINSTPVGMFPNVEDYPSIPYQILTLQHLLYDLIYNPDKTSFLRKGEEHGTSIKNGAEMLIIQAEESWRIWNEGK
jgi:shikimate dehydrogenase